MLPRSDVALAMVDLALDKWENGSTSSALGVGLFERHVGKPVSLMAPAGSKARNDANAAEYKHRKKEEEGGGSGCEVM